MTDSSSANVARFLFLQAERQPAGLAVKAPQGRGQDGRILYEELSFSELHAQSSQIACGFLERGITKGTRVLLMVRPGSDLIRCCFALFMTGAVPVVIDPGMGLKNFLACVRRTRPRALVGIPVAQWISRLFRGSFSGLQIRVPVGRRFSSWYSTFADTGFEMGDSAPHDLAAILFTSGSTGPPKGVCYGHGQFDAQVRLIRETFKIEPGEVDLPMLPIFALFNPALGMTTIVPEMNPGRPAAVEPARILQAIEQNGVTNSFGSPVLWRKIGFHAAKSGQRFPEMRRILMAGAPVPPQLVRLLQPLFPKACIWSPYGATECLPVSAIDGETISRESASKTVEGAGTCVGKPVAGVQIRIIAINPGVIEHLQDTEILPCGSIGEIIATGPSVTVAYDGQPEATARAKIRDSEGRIWHRMGDAGYLDDAGRLWFCGRIAEQVQTSGGLMYTDCCEGIFNTVDGVARSALIGIGKKPNQEPAIVIEPEEGRKLTADVILRKASSNPRTERIQKVFFCKAFPVDVRHNAKINRLELAERYQQS